MGLFIAILEITLVPVTGLILAKLMPKMSSSTLSIFIGYLIFLELRVLFVMPVNAIQSIVIWFCIWKLENMWTGDWRNDL